MVKIPSVINSTKRQVCQKKSLLLSQKQKTRYLYKCEFLNDAFNDWINVPNRPYRAQQLSSTLNV